LYLLAKLNHQAHLSCMLVYLIVCSHNR